MSPVLFFAVYAGDMLEWLMVEFIGWLWVNGISTHGDSNLWTMRGIWELHHWLIRYFFYCNSIYMKWREGNLLSFDCIFHVGSSSKVQFELILLPLLTRDKCYGIWLDFCGWIHLQCQSVFFWWYGPCREKSILTFKKTDLFQGFIQFRYWSRWFSVVKSFGTSRDSIWRNLFVWYSLYLDLYISSAGKWKHLCWFMIVA